MELNFTTEERRRIKKEAVWSEAKVMFVDSVKVLLPWEKWQREEKEKWDE